MKTIKTELIIQIPADATKREFIGYKWVDQNPRRKQWMAKAGPEYKTLYSAKRDLLKHLAAKSRKLEHLVIEKAVKTSFRYTEGDVIKFHETVEKQIIAPEFKEKTITRAIRKAKLCESLSDESVYLDVDEITSAAIDHRYVAIIISKTSPHIDDCPILDFDTESHLDDHDADEDDRLWLVFTDDERDLMMAKLSQGFEEYIDIDGKSRRED